MAADDAATNDDAATDDAATNDATAYVPATHDAIADVSITANDAATDDAVAHDVAATIDASEYHGPIDEHGSRIASHGTSRSSSSTTAVLPKYELSGSVP